MMMLEVENRSGLVRDPNTNAILNINKSEVELARALKKKRQEEGSKLLNIESEVASMKSDIAMLKDQNNQILTLLEKIACPK